MDAIFDCTHDYNQCHYIFSFTLVLSLIIKIDFSNIAIIIIYSNRFSFFLSLILLLFITHELSLNTASVRSTRNMFWRDFSEDKVCSLTAETFLL